MKTDIKEMEKTIEMDPKISEIVKTELQNEVGQVIVHCTYVPDIVGMCIRIWESTFLIPKNAGQYKSQLIYADNITMYPSWTWLHSKTPYVFTLVFSGLPKDCEFFDLIEEIPEDGGFKFYNIKRNETDVYCLQIV